MSRATGSARQRDRSLPAARHSSQGGPETAPGALPSDLLWAALLLAAAAVFFWPALGGGQSFYFRDHLIFYYPQAQLATAALSSGRLPLWEPTIGLGYPFCADPHPAVFYPPTWLLAVLGVPRGYDLLTWVHVPLGGLGLFFLLRGWRITALPAALGAMTFMFGGLTVGASSLLNVLRALGWAPVVMLTFDRFLARPGPRRFALAALALGTAGLGTDPQHLLFLAVLTAATALLRPEQAKLSTTKVLDSAAGAFVFSCLLAAVQLAPSAELFLRSERRQGTQDAELAHFQTRPAQFLGLALPLAFPEPSSPDFAASFPERDVPLFPDLYVGLPMLALATAALGWSGALRRTAAAAALMTAAGAALSVGHNLPFFAWLHTLVPPLRVFRYPSKYLFFCAVALAILAALGAEGLLRGPVRCRRIAALACLVAVLAATLLLADLASPASGVGRAFLATEATPAPPDLVAAVADRWLLGLWPSLLACGVLGLAAWRWAGSPRALAGLAAALAAAVMVSGTHRTCPLAPDGYVADPPRTAGLLTTVAGTTPPPRFAAFSPLGPLPTAVPLTSYQKLRLGRELMTQMRGTPFGVSALTASPALQPGSAAQLEGWIRSSDPTAGQAMAAAGGARFAVRVVSDAPPEARMLGRVGAVGVFELPRPTPRAFIAPLAVEAGPDGAAPSPESLLALPERASFRLPESATGGASLRPAAVRRCELVSYEPERVRLRIDLDGKGLLVLLDQAYPGWEARVDGQRRSLATVAGLFRGVQVSAGDREVEFVYRPLSVVVGAATTLTALLVAAWLLLRRQPGTR